VSAETLVVPASRLEAQVLDAVSDDAAVEDIFMLVDEALQAGVIGPEAMLKEVRDLARRQFRARALARKIDAALAEDAARRGVPMRGGAGPRGALPSVGLAFAGQGGGGQGGQMAAAVLRPMPALQQQQQQQQQVPMGGAYPALGRA
jgi:hypothetical protein